LVPLYFGYIFTNPHDAHRLHYLFATLSDSVPIIKMSAHLEDSNELLKKFEDDTYDHFKEKILIPLCTAVEEDLRLSSHLHLQLDDRNPFKVGGFKDLKHLLNIKPIRFFERMIDVNGRV
jgi:WASH complex subunit 7